MHVFIVQFLLFKEYVEFVNRLYDITSWFGAVYA